jgi:hypothetical protein
VLPLSHDEVVHGKGSLLGKMPGDPWQKLANLRLYLAFMYAHPGKKLLFMGAELAQPAEWNHDAELDWGLLEDPAHRGVHDLLRDLNRSTASSPPLWQADHTPDGFEWIDYSDADRGVLAFLRHDAGANPSTAGGLQLHAGGALRLSHRRAARRRLPRGAQHRLGALRRQQRRQPGARGRRAVPSHGRSQSVALTLPPLAAIYLEPEDDDGGAAPRRDGGRPAGRWAPPGPATASTSPVLGARGRVHLCLFDAAGDASWRASRCRPHGRHLARLPARRRARARLRLPRPRPLRAAPGASLQQAQAAARSVRPRADRRAALRQRDLRLQPRRREEWRQDISDSAAACRRRASSTRMPSTGAATARRHAAGPHRHLRAARRGFTRLHPEVPSHLRGTFLGLAQPAVLDYLVGSASPPSS